MTEQQDSVTPLPASAAAAAVAAAPSPARPVPSARSCSSSGASSAGIGARTHSNHKRRADRTEEDEAEGALVLGSDSKAKRRRGGSDSAFYSFNAAAAAAAATAAVGSPSSAPVTHLLSHRAASAIPPFRLAAAGALAPALSPVHAKAVGGGMAAASFPSSSHTTAFHLPPSQQLLLWQAQLNGAANLSQQQQQLQLQQQPHHSPQPLARSLSVQHRPMVTTTATRPTWELQRRASAGGSANHLSSNNNSNHTSYVSPGSALAAAIAASSCKLCISHLSADLLSVDTVTTWCKQFGEVVSVKLVPPDRCIVQFATHAAALAAFRSGSANSEQPPLGSRTVRLQWVVPKRDNNATAAATAGVASPLSFSAPSAIASPASASSQSNAAAAAASATASSSSSSAATMGGMTATGGFLVPHHLASIALPSSVTRTINGFIGATTAASPTRSPLPRLHSPSLLSPVAAGTGAGAGAGGGGGGGAGNASSAAASSSSSPVVELLRSARSREQRIQQAHHRAAHSKQMLDDELDSLRKEAQLATIVETDL